MKKKIKKAVKKVSSQELVIRVAPQVIIPTVDDLAQPLSSTGNKMALTKTWVSAGQLMNLVMRTPKEHIYTRPGKGGQKFSYVTGNYVEKVLNFVFGWNWDFEIVAHGKEGDFIWVHGKLIVKSPKGETITKSQFGRSEIKYMRNVARKPENMVDFGNDLKAASTDALKKCASLLGIASDVYGKTEYKQETGNEPRDNNTPPVAPKDSVSGPDMDKVLLCQKCDGIISQAGADFSKRLYGKQLCRECCKEIKPKK